MRILLIEDDPLLGDGVRAGLKQAGYSVDWARDGVEGLAALACTQYAALVLDLGLPQISGLDLLKRLRAGGSQLPVVIITAQDGIEDRIRGLDAGADDYVAKPFDHSELAARLRALLRRSASGANAVLRVGELQLDPGLRTLRFRGSPVQLSQREFRLLHELMIQAGRVLTRDQLQDRLYAWGEEIESNAIEVHVHHLRRKLAPDVIRTVRGVGYQIPRVDE